MKNMNYAQWAVAHAMPHGQMDSSGRAFIDGTCLTNNKFCLKILDENPFLSVRR